MGKQTCKWGLHWSGRASAGTDPCVACRAMPGSLPADICYLGGLLPWSFTPLRSMNSLATEERFLSIDGLTAELGMEPGPYSC